MKVILSGATGSIGGGVLKRLLAEDGVSSIIVLSRRELDVKNDKLRTIIVEDFLKYKPEVLDQLKGAAACIWSLGTPRSGREVHMDYTMAAATAFANSVAPIQSNAAQPFRFVYTSGMLAERDQNTTLWFMSEMRKMRGQIETCMLEFETEQRGAGRAWESFIMRPGFVTEREPPLGSHMLGKHVLNAELGAAMVEVAMYGHEKSILENAGLRKTGQDVLKRVNARGTN